jgi:wyosine [tRNA(Phe)-imidazoG37] synthetase (radical SAM superfamily)
MTECQTDAILVDRIAREARMQSDGEPGPEHERIYEHVIDALCSAAGRIVNVSFSADGEPILTEYP